jgi:hypothetical protein
MSYLYKDNPVFRWAEHIFVGIGAAHLLVMGYNNLRNVGLTPISKGQYQLLLPVLLGLLFFARLGPRNVHWLSRWPTAYIVGVGVGMTLRGMPSAQIVAQVKATMLPLTGLNNIVIVVGVLTTLSYFLFTGRPGPYREANARVGRYVMMVMFGVAFGAAVFGRTSMAISAVEKLVALFMR